MFTGIITKCGIVKFINPSKIIINSSDKNYWKDVKDGDSIAIDGVCLTVVIDNNDYYFNVSEETKKITSLNDKNYELNKEFFVNVEKSIQSKDYLGGHILYCHVHDYGIIDEIIKFENNYMDVWIKLNNNCNDKIRYKGSIAINGISLTIAEIKKTSDFTFIRVALIPSTIEKTTCKTFYINQKVNIEYNILEQQFSKNVKVETDDVLMERAIELGELGRCTAKYNPWVGCVFATPDGEILGEGYHFTAGEDHAEVVAYKNVIKNGNLDLVKGCNVYITLEPCDHVGRTPSCSDFLVELNVSKVFIACNDPDPITSGKGITKLKNNGITVIENFCRELALKSLKSYLYQREAGIPYTIAKIGISLDGKYCFDDYTSQWITGPDAREHGHSLRSQSQAIIVGTNTIIQDDPNLTVRLPNYKGNQPLCVILDRNGDFKEKYPKLNIFKNNNFIIFQGKKECNLENVLKKLSKEYGVIQCLIEGGGVLQSSFLKENLINEVYLYRGNCIIGNKGINWCNNLEISELGVKPHWQLINVEKLGNNILEQYKIISLLSQSIKLINNFLQKSETKFDDIEDAIEYIKNGKAIIVMDNENRENEGDIMIPAQFIKNDQMALMIRNTTGIICTSMTKEWAESKGLEQMTINTDPLGTAFTVTCDAKVTTTGVSSLERVQTVRLLSDPAVSENSFKRPGHIFPLVAKDFMMRQGHTEAGVVLCQLAHLNPVMVLAELQKENGEMMRRDDCYEFAKKNDMKIITTEKLLEYYLKSHCKMLAETDIYLRIGDKWKFSSWRSDDINFPHRVLIKGDCNVDDYVSVRIHSECFTGDVLGSKMCDCGDQLNKSMEYIADKGKGVIIFPANHEGRGIGLTNKIKAYDLMQRDKSIDTYEANCILGFKEDERSFDDCINILKEIIPCSKINLLTKNPDKINILSKYFTKIKSEPLIIESNEHNNNYLTVKKEKQLDIGFMKEPLHYMKNLPVPDIVAKAQLKICILKANWHSKLIDPFVDVYINKLEELGIDKKLIAISNVPGCNEIILAIKNLIASRKYDAIFCMGILIKGETLHFENVLNYINTSLSQLQLNCNIPIINNILSCLNEEQAVSRTRKDSELSLSLAITTIYMAMKKYM